MEQPLTVQGTSKWYLIASEGDVVMRVRAGMVLGETAAGELSFAPIDAQLKLDITDNGELIISAVEDLKLQSDNGFNHGYKRFERGCRTEIVLPNNVLQLDIDFTATAPATETLRVKEQSALRPKPADIQPPVQLGKQTATQTRPSIVVAAGIMALAVISLFLVERPTFEVEPPLAASTIESTDSVQTPLAHKIVTTTAIETTLLAPSKPLLPQRNPTPQLAQVTDTTYPIPVTNAKLLEERLEPEPKPDLKPETVIAPLPKPVPEVVNRAARNRAAELILERDLLAAELALAQGRLMAPKQTSAFTLFHRVLRSAPNSSQAKQGLSSVREALINRAFALLATASWEDALSTLEGAMEAGANPALVADLRGEVDYGQRLAHAQVGRFDELYPFSDLVAISQKSPRVRRSRSPTPQTVDVHFTVSTRGDVSDIDVLGDPPRGLEQAVRRAVDEWRFEPVLYNGRPLPVRTSLRIPIRS